MESSRSRIIVPVISTVSGILAGILGGWLTGHWSWGIAAGILILIAVAAGAEAVKARQDDRNDNSEDRAGDHPGDRTVSMAMADNAIVNNSTIAAGDIDQSQTINTRRGVLAPAAVAICIAALLGAVGGTVYVRTGSGGNPGTATPTPHTESSPAVRHPIYRYGPIYNPPQHFNAAAFNLPGGPPVVANGVAYSYTDDSLVATNMATGVRLWTLPLRGASNLISGPMSQNSPPVPGIVTDSSGQELIIAAYEDTLPGSGIQASKDQTQVIAVDTAGHVRWDKAAPAPLSALPVSFVASFSDTFGPAIVLDAGQTIVMDADSGSVRWTAKNVVPRGVASDKIIGEQMGSDEWTWTTVALTGAGGSQMWAGPTYSSLIAGEPPWLITAGPDRLVVPDDSGGTKLVDAVTGNIVTKLAPQTDLGAADYNCLFDGKETVVCWQPADNGNPAGHAIGFDARTGQKLWEIPANADQVSIDVTCAYDDRVYGNANGAVVLNARTGAQIVVDNNITAPTMVVPGYALDGTTVYRATG
jgi:outer membrane protein assembly factor BamB